MLHHIQRSIIDVLSSEESRRYGELKPADMDGNQFTYHLKQLIASKFVGQNDDGTYSLTAEGRTYLVHRYEELSDAAHTIFLMAITHGDNILLRKRLVQPSLGAVGFLHGEPTAPKPLTDSISERITSKTGLAARDIHIHSSGLIRIYRHDELQSFSHAIIVTAELDSEELPIAQDKTGENFWVSRHDLKAVPNLLPSCQDILQLLDQKNTSWFDLSYDESGTLST